MTRGAPERARGQGAGGARQLEAATRRDLAARDGRVRAQGAGPLNHLTLNLSLPSRDHTQATTAPTRQHMHAPPSHHTTTPPPTTLLPTRSAAVHYASPSAAAPARNTNKKRHPGDRGLSTNKRITTHSPRKKQRQTRSCH